MNQHDIKNRILQNLYEAFFLSNDGCNLRILAEQEGWGRTPFWNLIDRMTQEGLIKFRAQGGWYAIDSPGVLHAEKEGIAPEELAKTNQKARTQILLSLAKVYEEQGNLYTARNSELIEQTDFDENIVRGNLLMLLDLGYAESSGNAGSKLTYQGLRMVEEYRKNKGIADEFEDISEMSPQPRGQASFWTNLLALGEGKTALHERMTPHQRDYMSTSAGVSGLSFGYVVARHNSRVELYIDRGDVTVNKRIFDELLSHKDEIEAIFGEPLSWQRLEIKRACRIAYEFSLGGYKDDEASWQTIQAAMIDAMVRLERALSPFIAKLTRTK